MSSNILVSVALFANAAPHGDLERGVLVISPLRRPRHPRAGLPEIVTLNPRRLREISDLWEGAQEDNAYPRSAAGWRSWGAHRGLLGAEYLEKWVKVLEAARAASDLDGAWMARHRLRVWAMALEGHQNPLGPPMPEAIDCHDSCLSWQFDYSHYY